MDDTRTEAQRLRDLVEELRGLGLDKGKVAKRLCVHPTTLSRYLRKAREDDVADGTAKAPPVRAAWRRVYSIEPSAHVVELARHVVAEVTSAAVAT